MKSPLPVAASVVDRVQESPTLVTLRLRLADDSLHDQYRFEPGQFNMLYLFGVGEVPITITSDPDNRQWIDHTIRSVGRVTNRLVELQPGAALGFRGPFGRGWPLAEVAGRDIVFITGGLGCAPVVGAINYVAARRQQYGKINIMQGVKHANDLIWQERYDQWRQLPDTRVILAADVGTPIWPWHIGLVTELYDQLDYDPARTTVMMCGPEGMMHAVVKYMSDQGISSDHIWLSMERNMQCAVGLCGHCQFGPHFVCRQGPVFNYSQLQPYFGIRGF